MMAQYGTCMKHVFRVMLSKKVYQHSDVRSKKRGWTQILFFVVASASRNTFYHSTRLYIIFVCTTQLCSEIRVKPIGSAPTFRRGGHAPRAVLTSLQRLLLRATVFTKTSASYGLQVLHQVKNTDVKRPNLELRGYLGYFPPLCRG